MSPEPASTLTRARIEILGPFRVLDADGEQAQVPRGKNTGLLAYLAAESHGVDRDTLETTFWPDSSQRARRQSLRQALSTLRKILGCDPFVVGERVRLDPALRCPLSAGETDGSASAFRVAGTDISFPYRRASATSSPPTCSFRTLSRS